MVRVLLLAALCGPAAAYVAPTPGSDVPRPLSDSSALPSMQEQAYIDFEEPAQSSSGFSLMAGLGVGAVLGWLNSRKQQVASVAAAAAVAMTPASALAQNDYNGVAFLGGSDQVDINNATVQAYRQFPGMFPTAAGLIASHGPYKDVQDVYNIPEMPDKVKEIIKKFEKNLVCLPANPAYFIDRLNNGMYR